MMAPNSHVQSLEPRRLLTATFASINSHGTLSVVGTAKNDAITIEISNENIVANLNATSMKFPTANVKRIFIDGGRGNDRIRNKTSLGSTMVGSRGDDIDLVDY